MDGFHLPGKPMANFFQGALNGETERFLIAGGKISRPRDAWPSGLSNAPVLPLNGAPPGCTCPSLEPPDDVDACKK
jgi:hypothetical protein